MTAILHLALEKRADFEENQGARWAFFAIFIAVILLVVVGTIRVNKKRYRVGRQPIYGTRWMTPPSYVQSQHQYNQPRNQNQTYVPPYTAEANEQDMGYYDANGVFHPNPNLKVSNPYQEDGSGSNLNHPPASHARTTSNAEGVPLQDLDDISRPAGPPPGSSDNISPPPGPPPGASDDVSPPSGPPPGMDRDDDLGDISRPLGPPPGR